MIELAILDRFRNVHRADLLTVAEIGSNRGMRVPKGRLAVAADAILGVVEIDAALNRGRIGRPLSSDDIQKIRKLRADGLSLRETGRRVGIAANTVRRYCNV